MITTSNINSALVKRLENLGILITKDIKNVQPPSLYIKYIASNSTEVANATSQLRYSFGIYYFSDKQTFLDLTTREKELKKALKKPLKVEYTNDNEDDKKIKILDISSIEFDFNEDDYVLNCIINFEFMLSDEVNNRYDDEYNNEEIMDELEISY